MKLSYFVSALLVMAALRADEIYVTSIEDMGPGTLRAAMEAAMPNDSIFFLKTSLIRQSCSIATSPPSTGS